MGTEPVAYRSNWNCVLISCFSWRIIAWPLSYFAMNQWLQNFAFRSEIGLSIFPVLLGAALVIALGTISYQAVKAARANPVEALKCE